LVTHLLVTSGKAATSGEAETTITVSSLMAAGCPLLLTELILRMIVIVTLTLADIVTVATDSGIAVVTLSLRLLLILPMMITTLALITITLAAIIITLAVMIVELTVGSIIVVTVVSLSVIIVVVIMTMALAAEARKHLMMTTRAARRMIITLAMIIMHQIPVMITMMTMLPAMRIIMMTMLPAMRITMMPTAVMIIPILEMTTPLIRAMTVILPTKQLLQRFDHVNRIYLIG